MPSETNDTSTERPQRQASPWSFQVASLAGIPLRIHFTFLLFLGWIYVAVGSRGALTSVGLMVALFACVVLHELGHALTARHYGIQTRDITLYPIGGVAVIQGRPKPREELWIALAGPAVNVVLAVLIVGVSVLAAERLPLFSGFGRTSFLDSLFSANVVLAAFNMIPAFPMDGGRVLRALLARAMSEARATQIAGAIGQFLAVGIGLYGVLSENLLLLIVAFFVYLGAAQEVQAMLGYSLVRGKKVSDAMQRRFRTIASDASFETAAKMLLEGSQYDFPVVAGESVIGVLGRNDIAAGLTAEGSTGYVAGLARRDFERFHPNDELARAVEAIAQSGGKASLVFDQDQLVGMLTSENLNEFVMLEHARSQRKPGPFSFSP